MGKNASSASNANKDDSLWIRGRFFLIALVIVVFLGLNYILHFRASMLSRSDYDSIQSARYLVLQKRFNTQVIRPLDTERVKIAPDSSLPDFSHSLPYTLLNSWAIRGTRQYQMGRGEQAIVLLQMVLFVSCALLLRVFALRVFGRGAPVTKTLAFFVLSSSALSFSLTATPLFLAILAMLLLLIALFALDGNLARRPLFLYTLLGGVAYGLLCLSFYSCLVLFPVLLWHLLRTLKQRPLTILIFFGTTLLITAPEWIRALMLTRNPLYHAALPEIMMYTPTYPGDSLYYQAGLPQSVFSYLAGPGLLEVMQKVGRHLVASQPVLLTSLGTLVVPLFLGAALTRFRDNKMNHLRNFAYQMLVVHTVGLAFFAPPAHYRSVYVLYAPIAALMGAAFLESVVQARRLPNIYAKGIQWGWVGLACLPGLVTLLNPSSPPSPIKTIYRRLQEQATMTGLYTSNIGPMASNSPEEFAYQLSYPALALPMDEGAYLRTQDQMGDKIIAGVLLTPQILRYDGIETKIEREQEFGLRHWATLANSLDKTLELQFWISTLDAGTEANREKKKNWNALVLSNLKTPLAPNEIKGVVSGFSQGAIGIDRDAATKRVNWVFWAVTGNK